MEGHYDFPQLHAKICVVNSPLRGTMNDTTVAQQLLNHQLCYSDDISNINIPAMHETKTSKRPSNLIAGNSSSQTE